MKSLHQISEQSKRIKELININLSKHYGYIDFRLRQRKNGYFYYINYVTSHYFENIVNKYGYPLDRHKLYNKSDYQLTKEQINYFNENKIFHINK